MLSLKNFRDFLFATVLAINLCDLSDLAAQNLENSQQIRKSSEFVTPQILRGRVDFWVEIFAKYGKYQKVMHHRRFPQIRYKVLDFSKAASELSPLAYERLVERTEEAKIREIRANLKNLADNGKPSNEMEAFIEKQMSILPGGREKYLRALEEDMVRTQTGIKERYAEAVRRTGKYLGNMEQIFREEGLPRELTRIPFIESSFDYSAYSSVGAAGIWQFMPRTAKKYMTVSLYVDERLDPIVSTRAAAKYLRQAYGSLDTWPLAVTSYNHGVAGVYKKVKEAGTNDLARIIERTSGEPVFGFASSNFWPEVLAAIEIYEEWEKHFPGLELYSPVVTRGERLKSPMYIDHAAKYFGTTRADLIESNYALRPIVTSGRKLIPAGYVLKIPSSRGQIVSQTSEVAPVEPRAVSQESFVSMSGSVVEGGTGYTVRKGDTLKGIAKKFRTSVKELMAQNNLTSSTVKVGQRLIVHSAAIDTVGTGRSLERQSARERSKEKAIEDTAKKREKSTSAEKQYHMVKGGETLISIARQYGTSVERLKSLNGLKTSSIKQERRIRVK